MTMERRSQEWETLGRPGICGESGIGIKETFVTVLGIGTSKNTGDTFVLPQRYVHDFPAQDCTYMEKQTLNL
jgi:hypothetical protein